MPRFFSYLLSGPQSHLGPLPVAAEYPMRSSRSVSPCHAIALGALLCSLPTLQPSALLAQGCAPSRFASPILGSTGDVYLGHGTWQWGVAYRQLTSNQLIVGHHVRNDLAPNGIPSVVKSQSVFTSLTYG